MPETAEATTAIDPTTELSSVQNELKDFHNMGDNELIAVVQSVAKKYKTFTEYFRDYAPAIKMLHKKYARKGQRLPIDGKPTWDEFVKDTFGVTSRHLRNLLNPSEPLAPGDVEALFERMEKKPSSWIARIAGDSHARRRLGDGTKSSKSRRVFLGRSDEEK